jgi:hypothetical protein
MEELKAFDRLDVKTDRTDCGIITRLIAEEGVTNHGHNIEWKGKTVLANNFDEKDGTYELVYSIVDSDGKVEGNHLENSGILPTLFKSPDNELYVSVVPYDPDWKLVSHY